MRLPPRITGITVALLTALACSPALAVNDLSVTVAPSTVSGLGTNSSVATARAPVVNAGIVQQEIIQQIDPAKLRVTGLAGVTIPFGWTASFSADGNTFGAAPTTAAGWDAIRAVRAAGPIDSQGSYNGRQIATGAGTEVSPTSGSFVSTGGASGDGYDVFFDDRNHVFNVFHHDPWPNGRVDCHLRSGASCGPGWPFTIQGATSTKSMAAVDNRYDHLWVPTATPASGTPTPVPADQAGFVCVDIADMASGPRFCNGTFANSFIAMTRSYMTSTQFDNVNSLAVIGSRMFAWSLGEGTQANPSKLMCLDMHANGGQGAACPGSPLAVPGIHYADIWYSSLKASQGRLYAMGYSWSPSGTGAGCIVPATLQTCSGWSTGKVFSIGNQAAVIYEQPSTTGSIQGVCFQNTQTGAGKCFKEDGTDLTANTGLQGSISAGGWPVRNPDVAGTRSYYANYVNGNALYCYDVALNTGAGGNCPGWPVADPSNRAYTLVVDPYNANCVWRNGDDGVIKAYNSGGTVGCNSPPPWAELKADAIVPRMACSDSGAVREWRSFELTGPAASTYTSATLTVYTAGGRVVTSGGTTWKDVPIPANGLTVDLSSLNVADTGPDPTFRVTFQGRSTWDNVSAKVTAVGDAPELCVTYQAESVCPIAPMQVPAGPFSAPFATAVAATGSATLTGNSQLPFTPGSADITVQAAADGDCLGTISGTATIDTSPGPAAVAVPVRLKDAAGNVIATTVTDASGDYAFTRLAAGSGYRVEFGAVGGYTPEAPTASSASTNRVVTTGGTTDVDALYDTAISAPSRATTVPASGGVFDPFTAAGSSPPATTAPGNVFTSGAKALTRLCDPTTTPPQNGTTAPCTLTSRVTPEGTWSVNTTSSSPDVGKITFTPAAGFSGVAPAQGYQVTDSNLSRAGGTLTPTVVGAPTATANTSTGPYNIAQQIDVLANDTAATGATLDQATVKLCDIAPNAQTPPNCTRTSLTVPNEGTYAVHPTTGVVTFTPLATFTGQATAQTYQVTDSAGQVASSTVRPEVTAPTPPTATAAEAGVAAGIAKAFPAITGQGGLATAGGAALDATRTCLVDPANTSSCTTSVTTAQGTWTLNAQTGIASFTANQGLTPGALSPITYRVYDVTGLQVMSTLTPRLVGAPTATANTSTGPYNIAQQIDVLANDTAATGATLDQATVKLCDIAPNAQTPPNCTRTSLTVPNEGTYAVHPTTGVVTFTPLATFTGQATAQTYQVTDSAGQVASSTVRPEVTAPPVPVATPATATVAPGIAKAFPTLTEAQGLATSAADFTNSATCIVDPANSQCGTSVTTAQGVWSLDRTTGVVTFTADPGIAPGTVLTGITYSVTDALGRTATSTLTPELVGPPTATANTSTGPYNTAQQIDVLANDTAATGATLDQATVKLCDIAPNAQTPPNCTRTSLTVPNEGTYSVHPTTGVVTFTPLATFTGQATAQTYQVSDSAGQVASSTVRPEVTAPAAPAATPETKLVARGATASFTTLTGGSGLATSGAGFTTSATCLLTPGTSTCDADGIVTVAGEGTWTLDQTTGVVTFAASPNAALGELTPIGYRVTDALSRTATSTLRPIVPAPPSATDNAVSAVWNLPITFDPIANDQVDSRTALDPTTVTLCRMSPNAQTPPNCTLTSLSMPGEGAYVVNPVTGRITFTPDPAFTGTATQIRYQVADGAGQVTSARIDVSVAPQPPAASPARASVPHGGTATLTPAITPGTWPIDTTKSCLTTGTTCAPGATTLVLPEGTYVLDPATGVVTFTAAPGFSGTPANPPKLMLTDMGGQTATAILTVTVAPAPPAPPPADSSTPAPVALPDIESTGPGQPVTLPVLANDSGSGAQAFNPATLLLKDPATGRYAKQVSIPGEGTFTANADGTITFAPEPGFTGTTRRLDYRVSDLQGRTTTSTVQVNVRPGPPPWADPDYAQGPAGRPLMMSPLANDDAGPYPFDPSSLRLKDPKTGRLVTRVSIPGQGTYVVDTATGRVTFTPVKGFAGKATPVTYRVRTRGNQPAETTLNPHITAPGPALQIKTTASRSVLQVGQKTTITLRIGNAGGAMARSTITRAAIPGGFSVANPMGGTVRDGYIYFRTGNLKAGGSATRRFVLVASATAAGPERAVYGRSRGGNVGPVADPVMLRVMAPATTPVRVTG